jgi:glycosyltransferase involved in cell wall biosynthesis
MFLIDAIFINTGGAKVILESIISELRCNKIINKYYFLFDDRLPLESYDFLEKDNYLILRKNIASRKDFYIENSHLYDKIICLANVPPPINIKNIPVYILFHNAHLIKPNLKLYQFFYLIKYRLKWLYLLLKNKSSYNWIVQTKSMYKLLNSGLFVNKSKIILLPFFNEKMLPENSNKRNTQEISFAYIADGQPQKNHLFLLKTWQILFESYKINYKLVLTVSDLYPELISQINNLQKSGLNIQNIGNVSHAEVLSLYNTINYLIYPSLIESFGLPLIEAASFGCDVIAIDKEYVTDVIIPSKLFSEYKVIELVEIILELHQGHIFSKTTLVVENKIKNFIELIS